MQHSASVFNLEQASLSLTSTRVRIIYDKGFHGGNRAKNDKLSLVDRLKTRACILCRTPDSQDHWLHYCSHSTLANLRTSIVTELNVKLTEYRELSTLHRQAGVAFKHIFLTTKEPARIWTSNWSTAQIHEFCSMIDSRLLQDLKMTDLERIMKPLETILANGASGLWRCKQVHERLLQNQPRLAKLRSPKEKYKTTSKSKSTLNSCLPPRRRLKVTPLLTMGQPSLETALSFPEILPKQDKRLLAARHTSKTSTIVSNIDNQYLIAGAMLQRLCGNEHGTYYDSGRMHSTSVHGFLRLFQRSQGNSVRIASDEACDLLISKHHDQALKKLFGGTKRSMQLTLSGFFSFLRINEIVTTFSGPS
jgi:hypothetical protein